MAIYHLHAKSISRGKGQSAVASASYRSAEILHDDRLNYTYDYTRKEHVSYTEIMLPTGAPERLADRGTLWNEVERVENRKNSRLAREVEVSLPNELTHDEHIKLVQDFARAEFVKEGMIADIAIHNKDGNPHAHIMLTLREISAEGWDKKKNRDWNSKDQLMKWRKNWEVAINQELEKKHISDRVSCETLEAQGINRIPTVHVGVFHARENRERNRKIAELNAEIQSTEQQLLDAHQPDPTDSHLLDGFRLAYDRQTNFHPPKRADGLTARMLKRNGYSTHEQEIICRAFNQSLANMKISAKELSKTLFQYAREVGLTEKEMLNVIDVARTITNEQLRSIKHERTIER